MRTKRRSIAILLATWYAVVVATSGLFHSHNTGCCSHAHSAACSCDTADTSVLHSQNTPHRSGDSPSSDDGPCLICHFLAQKLIPAVLFVEIVSTPLVERTVHIEPVRAPSECPRSIHSRAPPAVA